MHGDRDGQTVGQRLEPCEDGREQTVGRRLLDRRIPAGQRAQDKMHEDVVGVAVGDAIAPDGHRAGAQPRQRKDAIGHHLAVHVAEQRIDFDVRLQIVGILHPQMRHVGPLLYWMRN